MSKLLKYILPAILVIVLLVVGYRSYSLYDRYSVLKGRYDALAEEYTQQKDESLQQIVGLRNIITQKDERIRNINTGIVEKEGEISTLHAQTAELESTYAKLKEELVSVDTLQLRVDNLETQVSIWKQKFTLSEGIIQDKDGVIFSLNAKYEAQVKISLEWKQMYDNEVVLHNLSEVRARIADKKLGGLRFTGTIKTGLVLGLAAVVIYGLVQ